MNVITLISIILVAWLIYSLIQSHNNIEKELREIRMKCIMPVSPSTNDTYSNPKNNPLNALKSGLISNLNNMLPQN